MQLSTESTHLAIDTLQPSDAPHPPAPRGASAWMPALLLAVLLLSAFELALALSVGVPLDEPRALSALTVIGALVLLGFALLTAVDSLLRRLMPRLSVVGWIVLAAPLAVLAAQALTSGKWIASTEQVELVRAGFVLAGVLACAGALLLVRRVAECEPHTPRRRLTLGVLTVFVLLSLLDALLFVGHYPAFHLALSAGSVGAAVLLGRLLLPRPGVLLAGLCALLLVALASAALVHGRGRAADAYVATTHGLVSRARLLTVAALDQLPGESPAAPIALPSLRSAPELLRSTSELGSARWSTHGELDVLGWRLALAGQGGSLRQLVSDLPLSGRSYILSAELQPEPGTAAEATLTLIDRRSGQRHSRSAQLGDGPLALRVEALLPEGASSLAATGPLFTLAPDSMATEQGLAFIARVPAELEPYADNVRGPELAGLLLLEDGQELGPVQTSHAVIREQGAGTWCLWGPWLRFSTRDGSDPRGNGRSYTLVRDAAALDLSADVGDLEVELSLTGSGAVTVQQISLTEPLPEGLALAELLGEEFRLVPTAGPAADAVRAATRSVIVVLLDALRADHVGPRADGTSLTPHLDALAADGVSFASVYSPSDHTGRSVPSMVSGLPLEVTLRAADWGAPLPTWLELLRHRGFATFSNGSVYVENKYAHLPLPPSLGAEWSGSPEQKDESLPLEVAAFARARAGLPLAVWSHWSYAHVGRSHDMSEAYARQVSYCDERVGQLVAQLKASGQWQHTLFIVTADHGYALGEAFRYLGAHGCGELSLRVPLVAHVPGLTQGGVRVERSVSNIALHATLLDVLAPDEPALVGEVSLLPLMLGQVDPATPQSPVFASTGFSSMTRLGSFKLTEDQSYRTTALFDLDADPAELDPVTNPVAERALRDARRAEQDRQTRLSQAIVARGRGDLAPDVVRAFARSDLSAERLAPVLARFWEHDGNSRRFLLSEIYRRRINGLGDDLLALWLADSERSPLPVLAAGQQQPRAPDAELLLVLATWAGQAHAAELLDSHLPALQPESREWLAALFPDLPHQVALRFAPKLLAVAQQAWGAGQEPLSSDGRFVALACRGLALHLPVDELDEVKDLSVTVFNAWSVNPDGDGPYFASVRDRKFIRRDLIDFMTSDPSPGDMARAEQLVPNRHTADRVADLARLLDTPEARTWMLDFLRNWNGVDEDPPGKHVAAMIPGLRSNPDVAFRAQASALIAERFPWLPSVE